MEKIGIIDRFKLLSKSKGNIQWKTATRSIIMVIIAAVLGILLGYTDGLKIIVSITLLATIIIDISLPIPNIIKLEGISVLMTILAFITVGLSAVNMQLFVIFTVLWAFFALSMYIFGSVYGILGFTFFLSYFIAVITVKPDLTIVNLVLYIVLSYAVASLILVPKIIFRNKNIKEIVAQGFKKETRLIDVIKNRQILSGIKLNSNLYHLLNLGIYITSLRGYYYKSLFHLSPNTQKLSESFIHVAEELGDQIGRTIISPDKFPPAQIETNELDKKLEEIDRILKTNPLNDSLDPTELNNELNNKSNSDLKEDLKGLSDISHFMRELIIKSLQILDKKADEKTDEKEIRPKKILSSNLSLKETLQSKFNLKNMYIRHALRFAIAMAIGLLIVNLTHTRDAIWVVMGILIIMKPDISSTRDNLILRVIFNMLGVVLAILLGTMFPQHTFIFLALVMLFLFRAFYPTHMGPSIMVLTIFIVLIWPQGTVLDNGIARFIDITLGGAIAFIMTYVILPNRITINVPEQLAKTINSASDVVKTVFISKKEDYDQHLTVKKIKNFLLEFNNLDAAIKKLQDSYKDVEEDVDTYQNLSSYIYSLVSDVTLLSSQMQIQNIYPDLSLKREEISKGLETASKMINNNSPGDLKSILPGEINQTEEILKNNNLNHLITWIEFDLNYIYQEVEKGFDKDTFQ